MACRGSLIVILKWETHTEDMWHVGLVGHSCIIFFSLNGGFTPFRHLRPSSGQEHTIA